MHSDRSNRGRKTIQRGWKAGLFDVKTRFFFLLSIGVCCLFSLIVIFAIHSSSNFDENMVENPEAIAQRVKNEIKTSPVLRPKVQPVLPVPPIKPKEEDKRNKMIEEEELQNDRRREYVSGIFKSLYYTYTNICSPVPHAVTEKTMCEDWFGYSLTRIDTLDALWLFKMRNEFFDSMRWVESNFDPSVPKVVSVSEATSRLLGGLLSAFEVSDQPIFLKKASQLADRLMPAFEGHTHGLPLPRIHLQTGVRSNWDDSKDTVSLGEVGSLQLEFSYLAHHLYEPKYAQKVLQIFQRLRLHPINDEPGLYASTLSLSTGKSQNRLYTLNNPSDSFFKNVFKLYRLFYKRVKWVNEMWADIVGGIMKHLATTSGTFAFPKEVNFETNQGGKTNQQGQTGELGIGHSSCAIAGLLALYAQDISGETEKSSSVLSFSNAFVTTCVAMNAVSATGMASEFTRLVDGKLLPVIDDTPTNFRADTFEALFYMFRLTGDPKHRNAAWQLFEAVSQHFQLQLPKSAFSKTSRTTIASLAQPTGKLNATSVRFLTKVLKFLYLTFSDPDELPISKNVWNSDGHVFSIFKPDITIYS